MSTRKPTTTFTNTQSTSSRLNAVLAAGVAAGRCTENRNDQTTKQQDLSNGYKQLPDTLSTSTLLSTLQTSIRDLKRQLRDKRKEAEVAESKPASDRTDEDETQAYVIDKEINDLEEQIKMMVVDRRRKLMQQTPLSSDDAIPLPPSIQELEEKIRNLKIKLLPDDVPSRELYWEIEELQQQISTAKSTPLASLGTFEELELKLQNKVQQLATLLRSNVPAQDGIDMDLRMEIVKLQHQIKIAKLMYLPSFGTIAGHEDMIRTRMERLTVLKINGTLDDANELDLLVKEIAKLEKELAIQKRKPLPSIESINELEQKISDKRMEMVKIKGKSSNSKTNYDVQKERELYTEIKILGGYIGVLMLYRYHGSKTNDRGKLDKEMLRMWQMRGNRPGMHMDELGMHGAT